MKSSRKLQTTETRKKIILSVQDLLSTMDVKDIKIRDICQKAGVSVGTFYVYFSCKEEAILYIYRECDEDFENLNMIDDINNNILTILKTYYSMVTLDNIPFTRHLYICQLTYFDSYFFDENRILFKLLNRQLQLLTNQTDTRNITWNVLEYARGRIFNLCIRFDAETTDWIDKQVALTWQYIQFLIKPSNISQA